MRHILTIGLFLLTLIPASTAVQAQQWVQLGCRDVDLNVDRDVIPVGARDGAYRRIMIVVEHSALEMHDVVVRFGDGSLFFDLVQLDDRLRLEVKAALEPDSESGSVFGIQRKLLAPRTSKPTPASPARSSASGNGWW